MESVKISAKAYKRFVEALRNVDIPAEYESADHTFMWEGTQDDLANCYLAIVAICHQTSPVGEHRLEGSVRGQIKAGWDYLKQKYLSEALKQEQWSKPQYWSQISPEDLASLFEDPKIGRTLNRISERTQLLNDVGTRLLRFKCNHIREAFVRCGETFSGQRGFGKFLGTLHAYRDPVMKKTCFFMSLALKECGWKLRDPQNLRSPVDYHELRGHLRFGTVEPNTRTLRDKIQLGLVLTEKEDTALRTKVQEVNDRAARDIGTSPSIIHYLCWNVFRNCCPRPPGRTHCSACKNDCKLPPQYSAMKGFRGHCIFSASCNSAKLDYKISEPPYAGDFY